MYKSKADSQIRSNRNWLVHHDRVMQMPVVGSKWSILFIKSRSKILFSWIILDTVLFTGLTVLVGSRWGEYLSWCITFRPTLRSIRTCSLTSAGALLFG